MNNKFNYTDFYTKILRLNNNSINILSKLTESLTSVNEEYIDVQLNDENGTILNYKIPSYSFLKTKMVELDRNLELLTSAKTQQITEYNEISDQKYFVEPSLNVPLKLENIAYAKDNNLFKYFNNIDLYYTLDATNKISPLTKEIEIQKIVLKDLNEQNKIDVSNIFIGRNDLVHSLTLETLEKLNIKYEIITDIYRFEPVELEASGTFLINQNIKTDIYATSESQLNLNKIEVDTLLYNKYVSKNSTIRYELQKGDILIHSKNKNVFFVIEKISIENDKKYIELFSPISSNELEMGNVLKLASGIKLDKKINIKCTPFEKQLIFIRELTPNLNITSHSYGAGISIDVSTLKIMDEGVEKSILDFYLEKIYDYSEFFNGLKSEMKISALYGLKPDSPVLDSSNFKVISINNHKINSIEGNTDSQKYVSDLTFYVSKKNSLLQSQLDNKSKLDELLKNQVALTNPEVINLQNNLTLIETELQSTINKITEISIKLAEFNIEVDTETFSAKYRIRGFWDFPVPKKDQKGRFQDVIQFDIQYRYLSLVEVPNCNTRIDFTDMSGNVKDAIFSEWVEYSTKTRERQWDEKLGRYLWDYQNVSETIPNVNQLDIAISPYEKVEIRVRSISEAGFPENLLKSEWSNSIIIEFPTEYYSISNSNENIINTIADSKANFETQTNFDLLFKKISSLESQVNKKINTGINFKYIYISDEIKSKGLLDIENISKFQNNLILINLEQGLVMNPTVDYHIKTNTNNILIQASYLNALNINDKLLLIYSN